MQSPLTSRVFRFGVFEADLHARELRKQGMQIKLQEQPFQVLAFLLEHAGQIVTREQLRQTLWPADTFVDVDNSVNSAINRLREALGDSAGSPRFVETLPRHGYRFVAPVTEVKGGESAFAVANASPVTHAPPDTVWLGRGSKTKRSWRKLAIASGISAMLVFASVWVWQKWRTAKGGPQITSLAVLPLENMTGDPAEEYLVDGITDALTTNLAQMGGIRVISRTSAMRFKGVKPPLPEIAKALQVDAVVEGSVSRPNDVMHINAQLIYAPGDSHIWARSYEGPSSSLSRIESEIANDVARKIGAATSPDSRGHLSPVVTVNPEAYDLYLRSEPYYGLEAREANDRAIRLLEKSVEIDPQFASAYAALATAYRVRAVDIQTNEPKWMEKASAAVGKALVLDPMLAEGYVSRGYLLWSPPNGWSHERAVSDYRRALQLNPNLAEAHHQLANVYNHIGLLDKAGVEIKKAIEVDPLNAGIRFRAGINLLYQGRYEESIAVLRDSQKFSPAIWAFQTSFALQHLGRRQEAQQRINTFLKASPLDPDGSLTSMQALLAADAGDAQLAERKIREAVAKGKSYQHFHHIAYAVASAYALLERREQALQFLRTAADDGFPCYPLFERDSNLNRLRNDPRFMSFLAEQKKQWEYFREHL